MTKTFALYCGVAVATLIGHWGLNTQQRLANQDIIIKASQTKERIQNDQINELMAGLRQSNQSLESSKTQGYIAGVTDMINRPDHYMAIWHNGYDRGSAVQQDVIKANYEGLQPVPEVTESGPVPTPINGDVIPAKLETQE